MFSSCPGVHSEHVYSIVMSLYEHACRNVSNARKCKPLFSIYTNKNVYIPQTIYIRTTLQWKPNTQKMNERLIIECHFWILNYLQWERKLLIFIRARLPSLKRSVRALAYKLHTCQNMPSCSKRSYIHYIMLSHHLMRQSQLIYVLIILIQKLL